ncbi:MAG: hypothetical protein U1A78_24995 [Polyangia bacterium]
MYNINLKTPALGGSSTIILPKGEPVTLTDIARGQVAGFPKESWGVLINQGLSAWVFGYEGGGGSSLTLSFDDNGNVTPSGSAGTTTKVSYRV